MGDAKQSLEDKTNPFCNLQYIRGLSEEEQKIHSGEKAVCLVDESRCPYYVKSGRFSYCKYYK